MDDRPVDALVKLQIDGRFEVPGRKSPGRHGGRHGLCRDQILSIEVRDRGCPPYISQIGGFGAYIAVIGPHGRHGDRGVAPHFEVIAQRRAVILQRLAIGVETAPVRHLGHHRIVIFGGELGQGLSEVIEKGVRPNAVAYNRPGQHREPGGGVIAPPGSEFLDHIVGPILRTDLGGIVEKRDHPALAHQIRPQEALIGVKIGGHIGAHGVLVQLIDLKARGLQGRRMVLGSGQRIAQSKHPPMALRRRPAKLAVGRHLGGQVDDV